jgi:hypothetical protein
MSVLVKPAGAASFGLRLRQGMEFIHGYICTKGFQKSLFRPYLVTRENLQANPFAQAGFPTTGLTEILSAPIETVKRDRAIHYSNSHFSEKRLQT